MNTTFDEKGVTIKFLKTTGKVNITLDKSQVDINKDIFIEIIVDSKKTVKFSTCDLIKKLESEILFTSLFSVNQENANDNTIINFKSDFADENVNEKENEKKEKENEKKEKGNEIDEPDDELMYMDDINLIQNADKIIIDAKEIGIEEHYRKNKISYRPFNLGGLYSKKWGIKSDKQRYQIRDLCRTCMIYIEKFKPQMEKMHLEKIEKQKNFRENLIKQKNETSDESIIIIPKSEENIKEKESLNLNQDESLRSLGNDLTNNDEVSNEYIYVIREREFVNSKTDIYKIGRTGNFIRRFSEYPKNSEVIFVSKVKNSCPIETFIIRTLKKEAKHRKDIGNEYFECKKDKIIQIVQDSIIKFS